MAQRSIAFRVITRSWLVLIAATVLASWLGLEDLRGGTHRGVLVGTVIAIAFAKVWIVGLSFMDLRTAPWPLRRLFEAWILAVGTTLIVICTH